tara:strand:- start:545 stop:673 length:129 start_codon:yes stop_codon:yes gene_type:complete
MNEKYEQYLLDKIDIMIENQIKLRRKNETFQSKKIQKEINNL